MTEALKPAPVAWLVTYKSGLTEAQIHAPAYSLDIVSAAPLTKMNTRELAVGDAMRIVDSMPDGLNGLYKSWGFEQYAKAVECFLGGEHHE